MTTEAVPNAEDAAAPPEQPDGGEPIAELLTGAEPVVPDAAAKEKDELNKRFSQVTRDKEAALRRAQESERLAALAMEALQRAGGGAKVEETKVEDPQPEPPKFADLKNPEEFTAQMAAYTQKLTAWTARREVDARFTQREQADSQRRQEGEITRMERDYQSHRQKALAELPDFEEIAESPDLPVTHVMAMAMKSYGDMAPRILYELGKNPTEAARIARLPAGMQFAAIGELKATLQMAKPQTKELPPPIKPQGAGRTVTRTIRDVGDSTDPGSMEEYASMRQARIRESRGAR